MRRPSDIDKVWMFLGSLVLTVVDISMYCFVPLSEEAAHKQVSSPNCGFILGVSRLMRKHTWLLLTLTLQRELFQSTG